MQVTAQELYRILTEDFKIIGQKGNLNFTLKNFTIKVEIKDEIGNLIQNWLANWMRNEQILFTENSNSKTFPDMFLNYGDKKTNLLELRIVDWKKMLSFDIENFNSYCDSLLTDAYRLDSDYLIIMYKVEGTQITIENVWLKKIWELSGGSKTYPVKVKEEKKHISSIRSIMWYSERSKFKGFNSKEDFLKALNETRKQCSKTSQDNADWLENVVKNYAEHTGITLSVE